MKITPPVKKISQQEGEKAVEGALSSRDFMSDQEVRWCPGCGDYSILKQMQTILPDIGVPKKDIVFISGIGCSSRFPYYLNTFGMHSIHGRAVPIASGLKAIRPELSVWVITGDGDGLSIGGNHMAHMLRRNFDLNVILFNNEIYGLTKGQYSPTSGMDTITKSTPLGSLDHPFNPAVFALGCDSTFVARTIDRDPKHLQEMLKRAAGHIGASFLEVYQNCNIFNDGAFFAFSDKDQKPENTLYVQHNKPMTFGINNEKGIRLDGCQPEVVSIGPDVSVDDLWVHDEKDRNKANILARLFDSPSNPNHAPRPFGVFYVEDRPTYEVLLQQQVQGAISKQGEGDLDALIAGHETWVID